MKSSKSNLKGMLTLFFGVSLAYFVWLVWKKVTDYFGDANTVFWVLAGIVVLGLILGFYNMNKLLKRFT